MKPEQLAKLPAVLFEIGKLVGSDLDPGILLSRIAELICQLVNAKACSVMLLDADRRRLLAKAAYGLRTERMHTLSFAVGEGVAGWVVERGESALIHDVSQDARFVQLPANQTPIASMLCVPLLARGERSAWSRRPAITSNAFDRRRPRARAVHLDDDRARYRECPPAPRRGHRPAHRRVQPRVPAPAAAAGDRGRDRPRPPALLAMVDVDHFKAVNDQYGHGVGDVVLAEVARRLRGAIRGGDLLVRYGGEEFLAVLPKADAGRAWEVGERMRQRVASARSMSAMASRSCCASPSASRSGGSARTMPDLIERADDALYGAKQRGRNRVEVAP